MYQNDPMGAALDRWILGSDDEPDEIDESCVECMAKNLEDDQEWACPYNADSEKCDADREADEKYEAEGDR